MDVGGGGTEAQSSPVAQSLIRQCRGCFQRVADDPFRWAWRTNDESMERNGPATRQENRQPPGTDRQEAGGRQKRRRGRGQKTGARKKEREKPSVPNGKVIRQFG